MNSWQILHGDVRERLRDLLDGSVQTCVTSPPYFGLRDYGCTGQIGLEPTPAAFVDALVLVFADVRRVLANDGTMWVNLGDSYANDGKWGGHTGGKHAAALHCSPIGRNKRYTGLKPKDLIGIPWRVAFALQADGWYLRSDIIWSKPNPMPESVTDRPTKAHEYIFLLSKRAAYYYDAAAIAESFADARMGCPGGGVRNYAPDDRRDGTDSKMLQWSGADRAGRNKRSVWHVATQAYPEAHFATFPEDLITPCILAGSRIGDTVLDPFNGSGTTGVVALNHQRNYIGIELNAEYVKLARKRIGAVSPLFAEEASA